MEKNQKPFEVRFYDQKREYLDFVCRLKDLDEVCDEIMIYAIRHKDAEFISITCWHGNAGLDFAINPIILNNMVYGGVYKEHIRKHLQQLVDLFAR